MFSTENQAAYPLIKCVDRNNGQAVTSNHSLIIIVCSNALSSHFFHVSFSCQQYQILFYIFIIHRENNTLPIAPAKTSFNPI